MGAVGLDHGAGVVGEQGVHQRAFGDRADARICGTRAKDMGAF